MLYLDIRCVPYMDLFYLGVSCICSRLIYQGVCLQLLFLGFFFQFCLFACVVYFFVCLDVLIF